jgi:thiol-disulfide isomerase/thioredoxin
MRNLVFSLLITVLFSGHASAALKANDVAPDFSLPDLSKKTYSLADFISSKNKENGKGVVIGFFASWCMPCRNELPILNGMVRELNNKGINVAIINVKENVETIKALLAELKVDKPTVLRDGKGKTAEKYQVRFLPITFFIGSDGRIKDMIFGEIADQNELRKSAEKLLK